MVREWASFLSGPFSSPNLAGHSKDREKLSEKLKPKDTTNLLAKADRDIRRGELLLNTLAEN